MISTRRMDIVEADSSDIDSIIALEEHPENRDYLWVGTYEDHLAEIADPNHLLLVFREKSFFNTTSSISSAHSFS